MSKMGREVITTKQLDELSRRYELIEKFRRAMGNSKDYSRAYDLFQWDPEVIITNSNLSDLRLLYDYLRSINKDDAQNFKRNIEEVILGWEK